MKKIWNRWKKIAEFIGGIQAQIIFSILYYLLITPVGLVIRFFSDYLNIRSKPVWHNYEDNTSSLEKLKMQ